MVQSEPGLPSTEPWASLAASCRLEAGDFEAFAGPARVAASSPREDDDKVAPQS